MTDQNEILSDAKARIAEATDADGLRAIENDFLGKKGAVQGLLASIPSLPPEERKAVGQGANQLNQATSQELEARRAAL